MVHGQLKNAQACVRTVRAMEADVAAESFDSLEFIDGRFFERYSRPQKLGAEVVGRVWSYRDVSEREQRLRRTLFLADATRLLGSLDVDAALDGVARLTTAFLTEACAVDLFNGQEARRVTSVPRDGLPALHPTARAGRALLYDADGRSHLGVPLVVRSDVVGGFTLVAHPGRVYQPVDLELAVELARRAAVWLDNHRAHQAARQALAARDEFLSIAAHEIRGPLTSIHLAVQGLSRGKIAPESQEKVFDIIEREDRRLARFVEELLDIARIRTRQLRFTLERVDLSALVQEVTGRLAQEVARSGSSLSVDAPNGITGMWDRTRLDQVVTNLLSNAIKFGLGRPIAVRVAASGGGARVDVTDHGIGIAPEMQERIFRPFERAVSVRHYGGLGLGLHIVRTVIEGLGGRLTVTSAPGAGSTFTVELPRDGAHGPPVP
jgi:signal transduction histidine kinase